MLGHRNTSARNYERACGRYIEGISPVSTRAAEIDGSLHSFYRNHSCAHGLGRAHDLVDGRISFCQHSDKGGYLGLVDAAFHYRAERARGILTAKQLAAGYTFDIARECFVIHGGGLNSRAMPKK